VRPRRKTKMANGPTAVLSSEESEALARDVIAEAHAGRTQAAWQRLQPLRKAQHRQPEAAMALLGIVYERCLERDAAVDVLSEVAQSHDQDFQVLSAVGGCLEAAIPINGLNGPPPNDSLFETGVEKLAGVGKV